MRQSTASGDCSEEPLLEPASAVRIIDLHQAPVARGEFVGDYEGLTTNGTTFEPFFIQAVTAPSNPTDAYFATSP